MSRKSLMISIGSAVALIAVVATILVSCQPKAVAPKAETDIPPYPTIALTCQELVSEADLQAFYSEPAEFGSINEQIMGAVGGIPTYYALDLLGGQSCYWQVGKWGTNNLGGIDGYRNLEISIRPDAENTFNEYLDYRGSDSVATTPACDLEGDYYKGCDFEGLVGKDWVRIHVDGIDVTLAVTATASFNGLVSNVKEKVENADRLKPWQMPKDTLVLPTSEECTVYITSAQLTEATGVGLLAIESDLRQKLLETRYVFDPVPGLASDENNEAVARCPILLDSPNVADQPLRAGEIVALTGGMWAQHDALTRDRADGEFEPLNLQRLKKGESAQISCNKEKTMCYVDLVIGKSWINFKLTNTYGFEVPLQFTDELDAVVTKIAQTMVDNLKA